MAPVTLSALALTCTLTTNHQMPSGAEGGLALALSGKAGAESGKAAPAEGQSHQDGAGATCVLSLPVAAGLEGPLAQRS